MKKNILEYNFPMDLKAMTVSEMELLSYGIRDFLLDNISKTGGHLAPNLGVVELTMAIHKVFDSPKDKIIWDVGHQSYVHKILTGRGRNFDTLRQFQGMSGFPKQKESVHDIFDTGHSSTSISIAAGMAAARDIKKESYDVIAVIGDGSMTGGLAFEALNNLGASGCKAIVILNDNGMSISPNIGGLSQHLGKLRLSKPYLNTKRILKGVSNVPLLGDKLYSGMRGLKEHLKYALISGGVIFEELGFTYLGPVDGHNLEDLLEIFQSAKRINGPVFIHVMTKKGKGYINAEKEPNKFHGIGPFDKESGATVASSGISYSKVAGDAVLEMAKEHSDIVAISAAMCDATGLGPFSKELPKRFFDVGIAESHGVTFAAGLANGGMKPFVFIYSTFLQRAFDQIIEDVCLMNLPVVFAIDRAGVVGADGETHHGLYDLAYLSTMPNMTILSPSDGNQLKNALRHAYEINGPVAIRYPRGTCSFQSEYADAGFDNKRIAYGSDVEIIPLGPALNKALEVKALLEEKGKSVGILSMQKMKPLDTSLINSEAKLLVTIEDATISNGFGENLVFKIRSNKRIINFAWPDEFISHGDIKSLEQRYGLDSVTIAERICDNLEK